MIKIESNLKAVMTSIASRLPIGELGSAVVRIAASSVMGEMIERIHEEGKNSEDRQIGKYSSSYKKVREANNRGTDSKVIMSLTSTLQNSYGIVQTEKGWDIRTIRNDYKAPKKANGEQSKAKPVTPAQKIEYNNRRYGAAIWDLTEKEKELLQRVLYFELGKLYR